MAKRIKGLLKNAGTTGEGSLVGKGGYHETWDTGKANYIKKIQKMTGINRPSE
ncbi:hypothetical protein [Desulforamulus aquiferis]|uniref:Uncharacterized protein n=1 Tax=Desulforamulus aquiferis TaxID=1397668 RepID=A0AAW7Z9L5_9FIRM|nr:hypothetical protein [Desulforamulus aquiferis]MDO7786007.1 hypothetical protein [Desulforamulus aquiferis]RYD04712.1 hypothetical protein N752_12340 [Desulforamulus aquiferis]